MNLRVEAIVCAVRAHGEHGAVVRVLTAEHGLLAGYVAGGASRKLRPTLSAGNIVAAAFRTKAVGALPGLTVEMVTSRAPLLIEPLPAAAIDWTTALAAVALPEAHPYPAIHAALDGILSAISNAGVARDWAAAILRYEHLVLAELGYGTLPDDDGLFAALVRSGRALDTQVLTGKRGEVLAARERLVERLKRAILR